MARGRQRNGDVIETEAGSEISPTGITNIPTDLLRTFVAICELGSFTKAAHLFELTQPAVSAHMRRLESLIGADLIEKSLAGVSLTECGAEVLRYARRMLAINDQIVSGGGLQSQAQVVRLGIPNLYAPTVLARILEEREAIGGEYAGVRGLGFGETAFVQRHLHEIRDEDGETDAIGQRRAVGVKEQGHLERIPGALLQHQRAVFALRDSALLRRSLRKSFNCCRKYETGRPDTLAFSGRPLPFG